MLDENKQDDINEKEETNDEIKTEVTAETDVSETSSGSKAGFIKGVLVGIVASALALVCITKIVNIVEINSGKKLMQNEMSALASTSVLDEETLTKLSELNGYIDMYYYKDVDKADLSEGLYEGIVSGIGDIYSNYYDEEAYNNLKISSTQSYSGIGAGIGTDADTKLCNIAYVYEGSPAESAGLKAGDIFMEVDGEDVSEMDSSELASVVRGEDGTIVHLKMYRPETSEYVEVDVTRANIEIPTVDSKMLTDEIGYIQITDFGAGTAAAFKEAEQTLAEQGMQKLIIDVRSNPGGMVTAVTEILDAILPEGVVVYTEDKYGNRNDYTSLGSTFMMYDMCVLINGNSASASEILAGALRDYKVATLVGTTTYGKGIVQTIFPLSDGDAIKLTTATYYTPNGDNIHGKGIDPDVELEYEYTGDAEAEYDFHYDNQVMKAIEVLESKSE